MECGFEFPTTPPAQRTDSKKNRSNHPGTEWEGERVKGSPMITIDARIVNSRTTPLFRSLSTPTPAQPRRHLGWTRYQTADILSPSTSPTSHHNPKWATTYQISPSHIH